MCGNLEMEFLIGVFLIADDSDDLTLFGHHRLRPNRPQPFGHHRSRHEGRGMRARGLPAPD